MERSRVPTLIRMQLCDGREHPRVLTIGTSNVVSTRGVPKDQSRAKRFDNAPRFTLKTGFSVSVHNQLNSNHHQSNDHKLTSLLPRSRRRAVRRVFSSLLLLAALVAVIGAIASSRQAGGSCARRRDRPVSIKQDRAVGDGTHWQWSAGGIFRCVD